MREAFHAELDQLGYQVAELAETAEAAMGRATQALQHGDRELAENVIAERSTFDAMHHRLDDHAVDLLARQQPVAGDLRTIIACLRMSTDLHRVVLRHPRQPVPETLRPMIERMGAVASRLVGKARAVLRSKDVEGAFAVERDDDEMDRLQESLYAELLARRWSDARAALDLALIGRYYERFADHAVSVAKRVAFIVGRTHLQQTVNRGSTMNTLTVGDVMTSDVTSVRTDTPFKSVVSALAARKISGAPVLDTDGAVVGVVSEADLLLKEAGDPPGALRPVSFWRHRSRARKARALVAAELMSSPPTTVTSGTSLHQAAALLARLGIKRLPVVDARGRLVGVVSRRDVLCAYLRADSQIAREIEQGVVRGAMCVDPATVGVRVRDGVVTLSGQLERKSLVASTDQLTRNVDGVVAVVNKLTYRLDDTRAWPQEPTSFWIRQWLWWR